ncbi:helix-turn-helix domain-containing protein [Chroococcidiopsis sp. SAG 2025]|uniref:helix-turn-helix domain-containing protein n=1 Tax=Chroococcidiopsis sp. SAG 2025 TaxID=171389 RepID=UPI002936EE73|nr:helix-turn-helix domain-containing protein [Chroococcidiopsis sp. SAG 2025]
MRTLERYTQEGKIGGRYEKGKTRSVVVYDEEELRAFKAALETKTYKPAVDPTPTNPDRDETALSKFVEVKHLLPLLDGLNHLADVLKVLREEQEIVRLTVPIQHKLTLSLAEASALSGISRQRLRAAIKDGTLTAQLIGRGYRVKRTDLEDYVDRL